MNDVEPTPIHDQLWVETYAPEYVPERPVSTDGMPDWLALLIVAVLIVFAVWTVA